MRVIRRTVQDNRCSLQEKESRRYTVEDEKEKEGAAESEKECTTESLEDSGSLAQTNLRHKQV